jgi:hypothetical protein
VAYLLGWSNLVYTGLILATFSRLNSVALYFSTSLALSAALDLWLGFRKISPLRTKPDVADDQGGRFDRIVRRALAATLGLAALASLVICCHYVPNNWDSCTYRFGRVFFYLSHGNLLHFANTYDLRLLYYPLNGVLAYVFFALYQFGAHWMYFVTGLAWVFAGLGIYSAARVLGASRTGSLVAAWLGVMSPNVLAQAAATNDEVLAATPILIGLGFGVVWLSTSRRRYAVLAGIGIGLGCGTKLHWTFYWVFVLAAVILFAIRSFRRPAARPELRRRIPDVLLAGCVALPLIGSFAVCNYISSGKIMDSRVAEPNLNRPFEISIAREKIRINTAQLFLNPIPDLVPPVHPEQRKAAYASFNEFFRKCCFSDLVETVKMSRSGYRFEGLAKPLGFRYHEYTVWLGFLPHLFLLVCLVGVWTRKLPIACLMLLASFFFWHATNSIQSLYIDDASAYYSYPAVLSIAALGPAWDLARNSRRLAGRVLLAGFFAVIATHVLLGANLLAFGGLRSVRFLWSEDSPPVEMHPVAPATIDAIRSARQIYIPYTHWEVLYWNYMRFNPAASYGTGLNFRPPTSGAMLLFGAAHEGTQDLLPVMLPKGTALGLTYLGSFEADQVFATTGNIGCGPADRTGYTVVPFYWIHGGSTGAFTQLQTVACCVGLEPPDGVEIRYELQSATGHSQVVHDWFLPGQPDNGLLLAAGAKYDTLTVETRRIGHPDEVARTVHYLGASVYTVGANDATKAGTPPPLVNIPTVAPEPYEHGGQHYLVSWLGKETPFFVTNPGKEVEGMIELQLATFGKPHTATLLSAGQLVGGPSRISHIFWENGAKAARFRVRLAHGENRFVLTSKETADELPGGRRVCFLLIGDVKVVPAIATKVGIFRAGQWQLDLSGTAQWNTATTLSGNFGSSDVIPVVGDWDGSGKTKVGIFRNGLWQLDLSGTPQWNPATMIQGTFGQQGDIPVVGDWDGSGKTKVGIFRNGLWQLDLSGTAQRNPATIIQGVVGRPGDIPVVGDWDGSGKTKVGVWRNGLWILDLSGTAQYSATTTIQGWLGWPGDKPVVGDWNGSGKTKVGIFRNGLWQLDLSGKAQWNPATIIQGTFGQQGDIPVVGDWDGSGRTKVGTWRNGLWQLDLSGIVQRNPATTRSGWLGRQGDVPVVGRW